MSRADYVRKYRRFYKNIPENNRKKSQELIEKLADVLMMMEQCKEHLDAEGCCTDMCQGNYSITRENPWSKVYDAKCKTMLSILDKLDKMLPDQKAENITKAGEGLARLVVGGKPIELR